MQPKPIEETRRPWPSVRFSKSHLASREAVDQPADLPIFSRSASSFASFTGQAHSTGGSMHSVVRNAVVAFVAALLVAASAVGAAADGKIEILWLGQSAMRIKTLAGKVIVIDPWLTKNPKAPP